MPEVQFDEGRLPPALIRTRANRWRTVAAASPSSWPSRCSISSARNSPDSCSRWRASSPRYRDLLCSVPFLTGYGVELGIMVDVLQEAGLGAMAQVDLGARQNRHQPLWDLSLMSSAVLRAMASRASLPQRGVCAPGPSRAWRALRTARRCTGTPWPPAAGRPARRAPQRAARAAPAGPGQAGRAGPGHRRLTGAGYGAGELAASATVGPGGPLRIAGPARRPSPGPARHRPDWPAGAELLRCATLRVPMPGRADRRSSGPGR